MAMTANGLRDAIRAQLDVQYPDAPAESKAEWDKVCQAFGDAIVPYLAANADVRITTGDAGLQRDNTMGNPATLAPNAPVILAGALE
jgi:hypothetical protein